MTKEERINRVINDVLEELYRENEKRLQKIRENAYKVWQDYSKEK